MCHICPMEHVAMYHRTYQHFNLSHGTLHTPHDPVFYCVPSVPWAYCNRPWGILTLQPLSHGTLCIPHGPVTCCVTYVPWTCCKGSWDILLLQPLSHGPACCLFHGHVAMDHGTSLEFNLYPMAQLPAVSHLSHGHVAMGDGTFYTLNLCPMGNSVCPMVLSAICHMDMFALDLGMFDTSASVPGAIVYTI
jgi:hypothetical protein